MKTSLHITLIQTHLSWENPVANRDSFSVQLETITSETDLIILPEMFTSGFTMNPESVAETMDGPTVQWMRQWASKLEAAICGSFVVQEEGHFYNRFVFVYPDGRTAHYDKRHRFMMAGEGEQYTAGTSHTIIVYQGWKIFPQICYDLRFPVFSRNVHDYDLLLYVANWPKTRIHAWDTLLKARAIENMCYCIGVNRVGLDANGLEYTGHSAVYDVLGAECAFANPPARPAGAESKLVTVVVEKEQLSSTRAKLPFLKDRDAFSLD